jgi:hypothetical protein
MVEIPISKYPTLYPVLHLPSPGILNGKELGECNPEMKITIKGDKNEIDALVTEYPDITLTISKISWSDFSRVLAKIAHAIIVGRYGTIGYEPLLPQLILGKNKYLSHYIGGKFETNDSAAYEKVQEDNYEIIITQEGHIIINITMMGGRLPTYSVVSGMITDWNAFLTNTSHVHLDEDGKYSSDIKTRFGYNYDWIHALIHMVRSAVQKHHPELIEYWPLLKYPVEFDSYALRSTHCLLVLKKSADKKVDIIGTNGAYHLSYDDHPSLPPRAEDLDAWQTWSRTRLALSHDQWPVIFPICDSGITHGIAKDLELCSEADKEFWLAQLNNLIELQLPHAIVNSYDGKPEYGHGMRTRFLFTHEWCNRIIKYIQFNVERNFPEHKEHWPLFLAGYSFITYALPPAHYLILLQCSSNEVPSGPDGVIVIPRNDHPEIPPKAEDLDAWQEWCHSCLLISEDIWPVILPVHDAGWFHGTNEDYKLFSKEDRSFWDAQLNYLIVSQFKEVFRKTSIQQSILK